jgi:branched-chain amino acid aminotransferase
MRTSGGHVVDLEPHQDRLGRSAAGLALDAPNAPALRDAIGATLAAAGNAESYLRVIVTRGAGEIGLDVALACDPITMVIVRPLVTPAAELYAQGVPIATVGVQRTSSKAVDPSVKSGNYLNNIMALAEARRAGAYEAVMCDAAGRVAEGSSSNLFVVRGDAITTPPVSVGLLAGITRGRVMELARGASIAVGEGTLVPDQVRTADEVFLTSSIRGVLPVAQVDGQRVGAAPGPITQRVMALYAGFLAQVARGEGDPGL